MKVMQYINFFKYLLVEAFLNWDEFDLAQSKSTIGLMTVEMDKGGKLYFSEDFESKLSYEDRKAYIVLNFSKKTVEVRSNVASNKIDSGTQQIIQKLLKESIIDKDWKVSFRDDEGLYKKGEYTRIKGTFDELPVSIWNRKSRINLGENFILYHGTSDAELPTILKYGLQPLGKKYTSPSISSRFKTKENQNFIYLATSFRRAYQYAKDRASHQMREHYKEQWEYLQYRSVEYWIIKPVVLEITVPDFTKLKSDDDRIISLIKTKAQELWNNLSSEEQDLKWEDTKQWFKKNIGFTPKESDRSSYYWVMSDEGLKYVLQRFDKTHWDDWKSSQKENQQIAYDGFIPPTFIKVKEL